MPKERAASRTAVLACQGRAAAHGRLAPGWFSDPVAITLLREDERAVVERVRAGTPPIGGADVAAVAGAAGAADRAAYDEVRACATAVVPRTVAIDDALRRHAQPQLVILGAGLDTRAWRMPELADVDVTELDRPAAQQDKQDRLDGMRPLARTHRFQGADLAAEDLERVLDSALDAAGHDADSPTTWLWEDAIASLRRAQVGRTLAVVERRSTRGSILVATYQAPSLRMRAGRIAAPLALGQLTPAQLARLLTDAGFGIRSDEDLATIARRIGSPVERGASLRNHRVAVAVRH